MPQTTITRLEFERDTGAAEQAASQGPVLITDGGQPSYVLLSHRDYSEMKKVPNNILDALSMEEGQNIDFDPPKMRLTIIDLLGMPEAEDIEFDPPKLDLQLKTVDFD